MGRCVESETDLFHRAQSVQGDAQRSFQDSQLNVWNRLLPPETGPSASGQLYPTLSMLPSAI
jgi:hypothetical protein